MINNRNGIKAVSVGVFDTPTKAFEGGKASPEFLALTEYRVTSYGLTEKLEHPAKVHSEFITGGYIEIWVCPTYNSTDFWSALIEWERTSIDPMRMYWYMQYNHAREEIRIANDRWQIEIEANEPTFEEGYDAGVHDGILMVNRELETSVLAKAEWRKDKPKNDIRTWQLLFIRQVANAQKAQRNADDALSLVLAIADTSPLDDTIRIELVKKLALKSQEIAYLEGELDEAKSVDYAVYWELVLETNLNTLWDNTTPEQHDHIREILKGLKNDL
jgi:hypothetical protein